MKGHLKYCLKCKEQYVSKRSDAKFCSNSCRQGSYLEDRFNLYVQKRIKGAEELTSEVLLIVSHFQFLFAKGEICYSDISTLIEKIDLLKTEILDLPVHKQIIEKALQASQVILSICRTNNERKIIINKENENKSINDLLNDLNQKCNQAFSFVYPKC